MSSVGQCCPRSSNDRQCSPLAKGSGLKERLDEERLTALWGGIRREVTLHLSLQISSEGTVSFELRSTHKIYIYSFYFLMPLLLCHTYT